MVPRAELIVMAPGRLFPTHAQRRACWPARGPEVMGPVRATSGVAVHGRGEACAMARLY